MKILFEQNNEQFEDKYLNKVRKKLDEIKREASFLRDRIFRIVLLWYA